MSSPVGDKLNDDKNIPSSEFDGFPEPDFDKIDDLDFWYYCVGVNIIPADTKNKKPLVVSWKEFQERELAEEEYLKNKITGKYENGIAVICGKIWRGKDKGKWLNGIDLDNELAIRKFCSSKKANVTIDQFKGENLCEFHEDNPNSLHIYIVTSEPIKPKTRGAIDLLLQPAIEVKSDGKGILYAAPSIHKAIITGIDNEQTESLFPWRFHIKKMPNSSSKEGLEKHIDTICEQYGIDYLKNYAKEKVKDKNKVGEGERHNTILTDFNRIVWDNIVDFYNCKITEDEIRQLCVEDAKKCVPPLPIEELERIFRDSFDHVKYIYEEDQSKASSKSDFFSDSEPEQEPIGREGQQGQEGRKGKQKKEKERKVKETSTNKYNDTRTDTLYETIYLNHKRWFVYIDKDGKLDLTKNVDYLDNTILVPQTDKITTKQYFFTREEMFDYWKKSEDITLSDLYKMSKAIWSKYVDADNRVISLCAADIIFTYFQDKFFITHYIYVLGENDSGKTIFLDLSREIAYRPFSAIDTSEASLYRCLGSVDEGQATLYLDETNRFTERTMDIMKGGYQKNKFVVKSDTEIDGQRTPQSYHTYCFKMMASEIGPEGMGLKGLNERTFKIKAMVGFPKVVLRDVLEDVKKHEFAKEWEGIDSFRKLMFMYRLRHYKDYFKCPRMNVRNRDRELIKPLIVMFYKTDVFPEIVDTLEYFLKQRHSIKSEGVEAEIFKIVAGFVSQDPQMTKWISPDLRSVFKPTNDISTSIPTFAILDAFVDASDGQYEKRRGDEDNKLSIDSPYYGKITARDIGKILHDRFGGEREKLHHKRCWTFNNERIRRLEKTYESFGKLEIYDD